MGVHARRRRWEGAVDRLPPMELERGEWARAYGEWLATREEWDDPPAIVAQRRIVTLEEMGAAMRVAFARLDRDRGE